MLRFAVPLAIALAAFTQAASAAPVPAAAIADPPRIFPNPRTTSNCSFRQAASA